MTSTPTLASKSEAISNGSDERIRRDVVAELQWDASIAPAAIAVWVQQGVVTLTGWADSYWKKLAAERAAYRIRGAKAIENDIEVRLPSLLDRPDPLIAVAALHAIRWNVALPIGKIEVMVSKGFMTLRGQVQWHYQKLTVAQVVRCLWGVKGISNLIVVHPRSAVVSDKPSIEAALARSGALDGRCIQVVVDDSRVVLTGVVRCSGEKDEAERAAWMAPGVTFVDNQIAVRLA
jgi:osmotically-inducible protein OsmY